MRGIYFAAAAAPQKPRSAVKYLPMSSSNRNAFLAHVRVGDAVVVAADCHATRAECLEAMQANLTKRDFEVVGHEAVATKMRASPLFGLFTADSAEFLAGFGMLWKGITACVQIYDIPAGTKLGSAQLGGDILELCFESGVLEATMRAP